ncbi:hypothetical protein [[Phormidium ambiguum] IAM M-71]|nr:hypothetical protein [Phormidium ambiguum]
MEKLNLTGEWQLIYASRGTVVTRRVASIPSWGEAKYFERAISLLLN